MSESIQTEKGRIDWVDNLKAIGIILVVLGHSGIAPKAAQYIYSFHMPLFFFLSGFLFSTKYGFGEFFKKKLRTLIAPYFLFSGVSYLLWLLHITLRHKEVDMYKPLVGIFYSNAQGGWMDYNIPLWFLTCLFVVEITFYIFAKFLKKDYQLLLILVLSGIIGYIDSQYFVLKLPWGIDVAFTAIVFFGFGFILKRREVLKSRVFDSYFYLLMFFGTNLGLSVLNGNVDMNGEQFNNIFYFYVCALSGLFTYIIISKKLGKINVLGFIGHSSLNIMAVHSLIFMFLYDFRYGFFKKFLQAPLPESTVFMPVLDSIIALLVILIFTRLVNNINVNTINKPVTISER